MFLRPFLVLVFLIAAVFPVPRSSEAQPLASLDLAALTLRPGDVEQTGWVHLGAFLQPIEAEAADVAAYRGRGLATEDVVARLRATGWQRKYVAVLGLPSVSDPSLPDRVIRSYITEYGDSAGAASGFAYLEDESGVVSAADVPLDLPLGEEAEATRDSGTSQGRPFRSLDVTFRTGNLVAGVTVVAYPAAGYANPELAEAEALAAVLASRLSTPPEPGTTIGSAVLRLHDSERPLTTYDDAYFRLAAVDVPLAEESKQDAGARIATYGRATDVYQLWQGIDAGTGAGFLFGVTLLRFPDAAAATTWVRDLSTLLDANPFYGDLSVQSAPEIGDQTAALAYAPGGGAAGDPHALLLAVRVGADVARVHLVPQGSVREVPEEALAELARAQSDCLRVLSCPGTFPVPSSLTTPVGVPDATPIASFDDGNWTRTERATRAVCAVAVVGRAPSQRVTERPSRDRLRLPLLTLTHG